MRLEIFYVIFQLLVFLYADGFIWFIIPVWDYFVDAIVDSELALLKHRKLKIKLFNLIIDVALNSSKGCKESISLMSRFD
jgi:hypothetical protein